MKHFRYLQELSLLAKSGGNWLANSKAGMRRKGGDRACREMGVTVGCSAMKEMGGFFFSAKARQVRRGQGPAARMQLASVCFRGWKGKRGFT